MSTEDVSRQDKPVSKSGTSRRRALAKGAGAVVAGLGIAALAEQPAAASVGTMQYGTQNQAGSDLTTLTSDATPATLYVTNTSPNGSGIVALNAASEPTFPGVYAASPGLGLWCAGNIAPLRLDPHIDAGPPVNAGQVGMLVVDSLGRLHLCVQEGPPLWARPGLNPITPFRLCDTRAGTGTPYSSGTKLGAGAVLALT